MYEMITLRPPFRAENMEGLCNRVIKGKYFLKYLFLGQYNKIPDKFNPDLMEIIKILLQVQPENRPNCGKNLF